MAEADKDKIEDPRLDLAKLLEQTALAAKDRLECYRELVEWEYIPEEIFEKMIENERLGMVAYLDNVLAYYRGAN